MPPVDVARGTSPLILAMPHVGTFLPDAIKARLNANGLRLADTDWHIERLYDGLVENATIVAATFHRYVIDANRDPQGTSLYPGQNTTGLVPETDFDGLAIWRDGMAPDADDLALRLRDFHAPYHAALSAEIDRVRAIHGVAVLYDCHSIRSRIPFLFEGRLPDFNIGTDGGKTCAPAMEAAALAIAARAEGFTHVLNGRFKGGWTTRHYGQPDKGVHAIQMELAQASHLTTEEPPFAYDDEKAGRLRPHLKAILDTIAAIAVSLTPEGARP